MRKTLLISFLFSLSLVSSSLLAQTKSVLFLGNSYTYYNGGLPTMLKNVANSLGDVMEVESNAPGGFTLEGHSTSVTSLDLISSRNWDYVVIQEQSQMPSFPPSQVEAGVYPFAKILCDSIYNNNSCTKTLFFMTWGYENGDATNCPYYTPLCTYLGMQWRLRQSYVEMAENNNAWAVPCGMAVKAVRESNPEIVLYAGDGSHPSMQGTYLAACTFYTSIYHKSPVGAYKPDEITIEEAAILQNAAWTVVTDSLDIWRIDTTTVRADFEALYTTKSEDGYYSNLSQNADSCLWEFGDETSEMQYPYVGNSFDFMSHEYPSVGEYTVCLTAYKDCTFAKICKTCDVIISDIQTNSANQFTIFPNPVKDNVLNTVNAPKSSCRIINAEGKIVAKSKIIDNKIDISGLKSGSYILQCGSETIKFVIE